MANKRKEWSLERVQKNAYMATYWRTSEKYREYRRRYMREYRERNGRHPSETPEKNRARATAWYHANKDRVREYYATPEARLRKSARRRTDLAPDDAAYVAILLKDPCSYCGRPAGELDHIDPLVDGGGTGWENLTAACRTCNAKKHRRPLVKHLRLVYGN